jgi:hypothetical protein
MKKLIFVAPSLAMLAVLAGCAAPNPNYHASNAYGRPADPNGWRVVSVTPVPLGSGARAAASGEAAVTTSPAPQSAYSTTYTTQPVYVQQQPVYIPQPVYVPQPVYEPRYYYPPVSIGLGFNFGRGWGHHRGWGGHIGTRFPYHYRR